MLRLTPDSKDFYMDVGSRGFLGHRGGEFTELKPCLGRLGTVA